MDSVTHLSPSLQSTSYLCIFRTKISERSNLQKLGSWFQRDFTLSGGKPLQYSWQWEHVVDTHHMVPQTGAEFRLEVRKAIKIKGLPS